MVHELALRGDWLQPTQKETRETRLREEDGCLWRLLDSTPVQDSASSETMQLPWLICHLTIVAAAPALSPSLFLRVWRIVNTMNDTDDADHRENREHRVCESAYCYEIAKKFQQNRDTTADPCENFYQYACGSWSRHNPIPDNEVDWSEDHIIIEKTNRRIRELLEERDSPTDIPPVKMARKFYRSCMDVDAIEKRGLKPIQEILDRTGGWPMAMPLKEWDPNGTPWQKIDKEYVRLIGNSAFYNIEYEVDLNNTKRYVLTIDQETEYPLASKTDLNKVFSNNEYATNILRIVQAFAREKGYTLNRRQLVTDVTRMIYFETKLLQILETGKEAHIVNDNYKRMTIRELQKYYNSSSVTSSTAKIDFLEMIQHAFNLANVRINSSEPVVVYNPEFLHKLARLLASTSRRVLVNYVQWNMVDVFLPYTTQEMRDIKFNMSLSSYNISNYTPRWQLCVLSLRMKNAVAYMFVKKHISDHVIQEATRMVKNIKDELKIRIGQAHWLSSSMRVKLTQKLDNLETQIGYPDWYRDNEAVTRYYEKLRIGPDYFENILNSEENELIKNLEDFRQVVARDQWLDLPTIVNAFYEDTVNAILIPAAELQDPYFSSHLPDAINYGATGFVIGHELSHGFDNEGIQFDKDGYKMEWTSEYESQYDERFMCFVDQYNNYTLDITNEDEDPVTLDGYLTESENIADSIGIQIAYSAYKKVAKQKIQSKLPGLENMSNDELFFLSFANSWCSSMRPKYEADVVNTDEHSPAKYRIIGSLSNMAAFSKTFKCPRNSSMNRRDKCTLWN